MSKILITGIATLDIINQLDHYPNENEELRATTQTVTTGGNAANTACVLVQFKHQIELACTLANDYNGKLINQYLKQHGVGLKHAYNIEGVSPLSNINLNLKNGSRTIIHYRDLPEFNFVNFKTIPVNEFDWLHFEGRNVSELDKILAYINKSELCPPISIEIEKERENINHLLSYGNVLIYSRIFVQGRGFTSAQIFLREIQKKNTQAIHVCPWGETGAWAIEPSGKIYFSSAYIPNKVIDTLGAGDTFNAGLIHGLVSGQTLEEALTIACQLAGKKVAQIGFDNLT